MTGMRIILLSVAAALFALNVQADQSGTPGLRSGLGELRARLALTPEQEAQVRPVFREYIEGWMATLEKLGAGARGAIDLQRLRALREARRVHGARLEKRLSGVLSGAQMAEFRRIRAERNERVHNRLLSRRADRIGAMLGLTEEQAGRVRPILKEHFKAQIAAVDKHGVAPGERDGGKRPGFRKLRRLRGELRGNNTAVLERLSAILSKAQLAAYRALQEEQRKKLRALWRQR